jgi:hypothetical protein
MWTPSASKMRFRPAGNYTAALKRSLMKLRRTMKPTQVGGGSDLRTDGSTGAFKPVGVSVTGVVILCEKRF